MNIRMLNEWKDKGYLQAYIDGTLQVNHEGKWIDLSSINNPQYYLSNIYEYRIKPQIEIGDLVKTRAGNIFHVAGMRDNLLFLQGGYSSLKEDVVKLKEVLKPHTFETAVKDIAENGFALQELGNIETLERHDFITDDEVMYPYSTHHKFLNGKPFCRVEYEECT